MIKVPHSLDHLHLPDSRLCRAAPSPQRLHPGLRLQGLLHRGQVHGGHQAPPRRRVCQPAEGHPPRLHPHDGVSRCDSFAPSSSGMRPAEDSPGCQHSRALSMSDGVWSVRGQVSSGRQLVSRGQAPTPSLTSLPAWMWVPQLAAACRVRRAAVRACRILATKPSQSRGVWCLHPGAPVMPCAAVHASCPRLSPCVRFHVSTCPSIRLSATPRSRGPGCSCRLPVAD